MNILITGATGFLGSNLISNLIETSNISVITSSVSKFNEKYPNIIAYSYDDLYQKNINFNKINCIIHCGFARNSDPFKLAESLNFTSELVMQSKASNVNKFINISSQSVYDQSRKEPAKETDIVKPKSLYAMAKYASEKIVESNFKNTNITYTSIRLASLTGDGFEYRMTDRFVKNVINNKPIKINGGGRQIISYLDGTKCAEIIIQFIKLPILPEKCNLGTENYYTLNEIIDIIKNTGGKYGYIPKVEITETDDFINSSLNIDVLKSYLSTDLKWNLIENIDNLYKKYMRVK